MSCKALSIKFVKRNLDQFKDSQRSLPLFMFQYLYQLFIIQVKRIRRSISFRAFTECTVRPRGILARDISPTADVAEAPLFVIVSRRHRRDGPRAKRDLQIPA